MDRSQVAVRVGEGRVNGDGFVVASNGRSRVADFLEGVAEIRVGVGEGGLDADGFTVVLQRLVKATLLLQHRGQVAVSSGEFGVNLQGFLVKADCLGDFPALSLDVGLERKWVEIVVKANCFGDFPALFLDFGLEREWVERDSCKCKLFWRFFCALFEC